MKGFSLGPEKNWTFSHSVWKSPKISYLFNDSGFQISNQLKARKILRFSRQIEGFNYLRISWGNFLQVENGTLFNDNWNCVFSVKKTVKKTISSLFSPRVKKTVKKTISSSFSSLVEKTVKKNPKTVFSSLKTHNSSYHWTKFHSQLVKSLLMKSFFLA